MVSGWFTGSLSKEKGKHVRRDTSYRNLQHKSNGFCVDQTMLAKNMPTIYTD